MDAKIGNLPAEAEANGSLNPSTPEAQRSVNGVAVSTGPVIGEKGEYKPASYLSTRGNVRTDR